MEPNRVSDRMKLRRWALNMLWVIGGLCLTLSTHGALPASAGDNPPPPRTQSDQPAPHREPIVLGTHAVASGESATVIEVPPAADAYLASGHPDQNFGGGALFLGYDLDDGFNAQRIILRFDLGGIPSDAVVDDARLRMYLIYGSPSNDAAMGTIVRRLASAWDEYSVTWNTEPSWASVRDEFQCGRQPGLVRVEPHRSDHRLGARRAGQPGR